MHEIKIDKAHCLFPREVPWATYFVGNRELLKVLCGDVPSGNTE